MVQFVIGTVFGILAYHTALTFYIVWKEDKEKRKGRKNEKGD